MQYPNIQKVTIPDKMAAWKCVVGPVGKILSINGNQKHHSTIFEKFIGNI